LYYAKGFGSSWRPQTFIRQLNGYDDGNPDTDADPTWVPLRPTPAHPDFPGAHATATSSVVEVFTDILGGDEIDWTLQPFTPTNPLAKPRSFTSLQALLEDLKGARIWVGIHTRHSGDAGESIGRKVGHFVETHALRRAHGHRGIHCTTD